METLNLILNLAIILFALMHIVRLFNYLRKQKKEHKRITSEIKKFYDNGCKPTIDNGGVCCRCSSMIMKPSDRFSIKFKPTTCDNCVKADTRDESIVSLLDPSIFKTIKRKYKKVEAFLTQKGKVQWLPLTLFGLTMLIGLVNVILLNNSIILRVLSNITNVIGWIILTIQVNKNYKN